MYIGIADGAKTNWTFLTQHTDKQLLDFFHVTEYLANAAHAAYPKDALNRESWLEKACTSLKHEQGAVETLIVQIEKISQKKSLSKTRRQQVIAALTYFNNHWHMMDYAAHIEQTLPIGSGVTEAACKTLVPRPRNKADNPP